ncbi:MAG: GNAT family N-acetyltransferase [Rhodanobacter sp.]
MSDPAPTWLAPAPEDSRRFNIQVVRGRIDAVMPKSGVLQAEIATLQADVAIIRLPAGRLEPILDLIASGYVPIHADTLVCHSRTLDASVADSSTGGRLSVEIASAADSARIQEIAVQSFSLYRSHYHANPLFDRDRISEAYGEWAVAFLNAPSPDRETWIARVPGEIVGFATCALHMTDNSVEVILNAVAPNYVRRGVYSYMLNQLLVNYRKRGFAAVHISTQVWNYIVQKAWARAGFAISHAYDTYHVNKPPNQG